MAATLGVATLSYLPFAFFNWINPLIALIFGIFCIRILPLEADPAERPESLPGRDEALPGTA